MWALIVALPERHVLDDLVHPDAHRDRGDLVLVLGADLAGLRQPLVTQERILVHATTPDFLPLDTARCIPA